MKTYKPLLIAVLLLFGATAFAQRTITGTVVDNIGEPVPFATVGVVGTTIGTTTDFDGNFSLSVPADATRIQVSFMGFESRIIELGTASTFSVVLESQMTQLDEVVVVGFGTTTRRNLTASVVSVSADALRDNPVTQVADALTGRLAGVQVSTSEGSPDAEITIRVRGGGSITQSSSPLFIVDGFPVESISDLSPSEIATLDVLKDAAATAIYGARGANGVVIITTRGGQEGRITASYNFFTTIQRQARRLPVLSPYEFALWQYELQMLRDGGTRGTNFNDNYVRLFGLFEDIDLYRNVSGNDWQDIIFGNTGHIFNHSLNVSGGNPFARFSATYNRINNESIMMGSYFQRDNLNFRTTWNPLRGLSIDFTTRYSRTHIRGSGANDQAGTTTDARMRHVMVYSPIPLRGFDLDPGDDEAAVGGLHAPPTVSVEDNDRRRQQERLSIQGGVSYELIPGLRLRTEFGIDNTAQTDYRFWGLSTFMTRPGGGTTAPGYPVATWTDLNRRTLRNTNTILWNLDERMPGNHHLDLLAGHEMIMTSSNTASMRGDGFPTFFTADQAWNFMSFRPGAVDGSTIIGNVFGVDDNLLSFFGRANWRLGGTYLASITMRGDGSSRFAAGNQWGFFPSASLGWRLSDEPFLQTVFPSSIFDNFMLRLSIGMAGNNDIPGGNIERLMTAGTTPWLSSGSAIWTAGNVMPNPDLRWETMVTQNVGLSFNLFNFRMGGTVDFYRNTTRDLLVRFPVAGTGYAFQYQNIGSTENMGVDIALDGRIIQRGNFTLDANFNIAFNRSRVTSLGGLDEIIARSDWHGTQLSPVDDFRVFVGQPLGQMWGFRADGRYSAHDFTFVGGTGAAAWQLNEGVVRSGVTGHVLVPGAIRFKDIDGDGVVDNNDLTVIGNATPRFTGGFGFTGRFHGFDFSAHFSFVYGNDILNANKIDWSTTTNNNNHRNLLETMSHGSRWTFIDGSGNFITDPTQLEAMNAHHSNIMPWTTTAMFSCWAVEDGSFLRANNITVGYTVPREITRRAGMQTLRFFATVNNAFILTNYSGFDPEVNTRRATPLTPGVDFSAFPRSRGYTFGVNVTF